MSHAGTQRARTLIFGQRRASDATRRHRRAHPKLEALESRRLLAVFPVHTWTSLVRAGRDSSIPVADPPGLIYALSSDEVASATIDWGDGSTPTKGAGRPFDLSSRHTYFVPGTYQATETFTMHGAGHADYAVSGTATVEVVPHVLVTINQGPLHVRLGESTKADIPVQIVTDINEADLNVTVDWGDGTAPAAATLKSNFNHFVDGTFSKYSSLAYNDGQPFDVHGDHVYASAGSYTAHVTIAGPEGSKEVDVPVVVTDGPIEVDLGPESYIPPGYAARLAVGTVQDLANVLGEDGYYQPIPYTLSVGWGDGTPDELVPGVFNSPQYFTSGHAAVDAIGNHIYKLPGDYTATLHVVTSDGFAAQISTRIHVLPEVFTLKGTTATTTTGSDQAFLVATEMDSFPKRTSYDFLRTSIDWGDGSEIVTDQGDGTLRISSFHTYDKPGVYDVHVKVAATSGASAETDSTITVLPFDATPSNLIGVAGVSSANQTLATVGLPDRDSDPSTYSATINWGDGSAIQAASIGTQTAAHDPWLGLPGPRVVATVLGSHAYASAGTYYATIVVTGPGGTSRTLVVTATIAQPPAAPPAPTAPPKTPTPTAPAPPRGHYVEVYQYGHPDQAKRVWVADVATTSVTPKPRHHPRGPRHPRRGSRPA